MLICNRTPGTHHAAIMPLDFPSRFWEPGIGAGTSIPGVYGLGSLFGILKSSFKNCTWTSAENKGQAQRIK